MLAETQLLASSPEIRPHLEVVQTADSFCDAYQEATALVRHGLEVAKHQLGFSDHEFAKVERVIQAPQMASYVEKAVQNGNYSSMLADEQMRSYVLEMARTAVLGRIVEREYHRDRHSVSRAYMERIIAMNHSWITFAASEYAQKIGFGRSHLRRVISSATGLAPQNENVEALEKGLSVEIGTKRFLEKTGGPLGISVRWSSEIEDVKKVDIICEQGKKSLDVQVKSKDYVGHQGGDPKAHYTPIEHAGGPHEYRVRELCPAQATAIGENFEIKAPRYAQVMEQMLLDFNILS